MKAAQKLLGVLTIGRGSAWAGGWWLRELKEANKPPSQPKYTKMAPKTGGLIDLKIAENVVFAQKYLRRYILLRCFLRKLINFKIFGYLRRCGVISV